MHIQDVIDGHIRSAYDLAILEVERRARKLLKSSNNITSFTMAMGTFFITDKNNKVMWQWQMREYKGFRDIEEFIIKNEELKLTGEAMSFTAFGPKITQW